MLQECGWLDSVQRSAIAKLGAELRLSVSDRLPSRLSDRTVIEGEI